MTNQIKTTSFAQIANLDSSLRETIVFNVAKSAKWSVYTTVGNLNRLIDAEARTGRSKVNLPENRPQTEVLRDIIEAKASVYESCRVWLETQDVVWALKSLENKQQATMPKDKLTDEEYKMYALAAGVTVESLKAKNLKQRADQMAMNQKQIDDAETLVADYLMMAQPDDLEAIAGDYTDTVEYSIKSFRENILRKDSSDVFLFSKDLEQLGYKTPVAVDEQAPEATTTAKRTVFRSAA